MHLKCPWRIAIAAHAANLLHLKTQGFIAHEINSNLLRLQCPSFSLPKPLVWCKFANFQSRVHPSPSNPHVYPSACSINASIIAGEVQVQASKSKSHRFLLEKMTVRCPNDNSKSKSSLSNHWCMHHSLLSLHDRLVSIKTRRVRMFRRNLWPGYGCWGPRPNATGCPANCSAVPSSSRCRTKPGPKRKRSEMRNEKVQHNTAYYQILSAHGHACCRSCHETRFLL